MFVLGLVPAAIIFDAIWSFPTGWRPPGFLEKAVLALAGASLVLVFVTFSLSPGRRQLARLAPQLTALIVAIVGPIALLEWVIRLQGLTPDPLFHCMAPNQVWINYIDTSFMPGVDELSRFTTNRFGLRGLDWPPRPEAYRILCVGGSTTQCAGLSDDQTWMSLVGAACAQGPPPRSTWVGGAGVPAYTSKEHLKFLQEVSIATEVDAVVMLVGVNDLWVDLVGKGGGSANFSLAGEAIPEFNVRKPLWADCHILRAVRQIKTILKLNPAGTPPSREYAEFVAKKRAARAAATLLPTLPDLTRELQNYGERLAAIADVCKARNQKLIFIEQPVLWSDPADPVVENRLWFGWTRDPKAYYATAALRRGMEAYNAELKRIAQAKGVAIVSTATMHGNPAFFYDDCHLTIAGAAELARLAAPVVAAATGR
jgi:lysophospholipase L1-like esterase